MSTTSDSVTTNRTKPWCKTDVPVCPECGELKCLCRPRFFAGQLLSEEDLNRLDRYMMDKNRLHNRYLHGWGVVCGLEVRCHPCDNLVTVSEGYALGPCGDDIVVCKEDTVDVCELIKRCRDKERGDMECRPYGATPDCDGAEEDWVLAIRYEEHPSRGITALRGGACDDGRAKKSCGCNGGAGAGGCGGKNTEPVSKPKPRGAPAECEPTLVCEDYRYEVFRAPAKIAGDRDPPANRLTKDPLLDWLCFLPGSVARRICCCWAELLNSIPEVPRDRGNLTQNQLFQICCTFKKSLSNYLINHPPRNCRLKEQLNAAVCPQPGQPPREFDDAFLAAVSNLSLIATEVLTECLCSALLPQCPEPATDPRVPLAVIKIRSKDCRIISICNWTSLRKIAVTWPAVQYWFSWLPIFHEWRDYLQTICCREAEILPTGTQAAETQPGGAVPSTVHFPRPPSSLTTPFTTELLMRLKRSPGPMTTLDLIKAVASPRDHGIALTERDAEKTPEFQLLNQLLLPMVAGLGPESIAAIIGPQAGGAPTEIAEGVGAVTGLRTELKDLQARLNAQQEELAALRAELKKSLGG